ncbi:MAG TPA: Wzz/FepE/Etk N-terminal domain-containing protein [Edaphocola sp.]|nr:Wzz/FepE/Etk N-terminal domain-containing protein [Edaphocola sp.]
MENFSFDLFDILKVLKKKRKTIILFTALGIIASIVFVLIRNNEYTSETKIILKSSMYFDRNQIQDENSYYAKEVFARESEIDKALTVLGNSDVISYIVEETNYQKIKGLSESQSFRRVKNNLKIKRTDNSDIEVKFTDEDPELALKGIRAGLYKAEMMYINFFEDFFKDASVQIDFKLKSNSDSLTIINEEITKLRKDYNLYNVLTPTRGNTVVNNNIKLSAQNSEGAEQLKTLVTIKDRLDQEQATLTGLKSQYNNFSSNDKIHAFYKVGGPYLPSNPSNLNALIIIGGAAVASFFFSCFWVIIGRAWKKLDD